MLVDNCELARQHSPHIDVGGVRLEALVVAQDLHQSTANRDTITYANSGASNVTQHHSLLLESRSGEKAHGCARNQFDKQSSIKTQILQLLLPESKEHLG